MLGKCRLIGNAKIKGKEIEVGRRIKESITNGINNQIQLGTTGTYCGKTQGGSLPQVLVFNLSDGNVKALTDPANEPVDNLTLLFERLGRRKKYLRLSIHYKHYICPPHLDLIPVSIIVANCHWDMQIPTDDKNTYKS
jgi:hypothetical protein